MKLKEILAISGQSGLYKFVAQSKNGIIVEQLGSGVRSCASASAKVSSLGEIAIFTENDDVPLAQVFQQIYDKHAGQPVLSHKSAPEDLKKFFAEALPEYDRDRVHVFGYQESGTVVQPAFGSGNDRLQGRRASGRENARRGIEPLFPQRDARRSPKVQW